ncbi:O-antigen polymerase [Gracilimonas sediminicola]|uniref:Oligosaccharide repeat unit polymerase n=1 Tax=Gracilimonas sediminicola TaxID=2952158 RepID=A0A9X2L4S2_9BACT|nr:O-antigen polymerase [Gracilimonas sediminicola]MCP9292294.1 oligosaccharide repeat unit polymerase [Gracilimonas sediminicola]
MVLYQRHKTLFNPFSFYLIIWSLTTIIPLLLVLNYSISFYTSIYILLCNFLFVLPSIIFPKIKIKKKAFLKIKYLMRANVLLINISIVFIIIHLYFNGYTLFDYIRAPFEVTSTLVAAKYAETLDRSIFSVVSTIFIYPNSFLSGYIYGITKKKKFSYYYLIPSLMYFIIFGNKGFIFVSIVLYIAGFILVQYEKGEKLKITKKTIYIAIGSFVFILAIVIVAFISRANSLGGDALYNYLIKGIRSYSSGHLFAFDDFFKSQIGLDHKMNYLKNEDSLFFYTFKSIYNLFGYEGNIPHEGMYAVSFENEYVKSNIYTHFRAIIQDIGILGSLVYFNVLGYILNIIFTTSYKHKVLIRTVAWYMMFSYSYSSFLNSNMVWVSSVIGPIIILMFLLRERIKW